MADVIIRDVSGNTLAVVEELDVEPYLPPQTGMAGEIHTSAAGNYIVTLYTHEDLTSEDV